MTLDRLLDNSWLGTKDQKDQAMTRSLEYSAPNPHPLERGQRLEMTSITDYFCVRKPPYRILVVGGLESLQLSNTIHTGRMTFTSSREQEGAVLRTLSDHALRASSSVIPSTRLVNIVVSLSSVCCSSKLIQPKGGDLWNLLQQVGQKHR